MIDVNATGVIVTAVNNRPAKPVIGRPESANLDVRAIRLASRSIGSTQQTFADAIGVTVKTLRNWEQRRRKPTGPALVLLTMIQRDPWIVFDVLSGKRSQG